MASARSVQFVPGSPLVPGSHHSSHTNSGVEEGVDAPERVNTRAPMLGASAEMQNGSLSSFARNANGEPFDADIGGNSIEMGSSRVGRRAANVSVDASGAPHLVRIDRMTIHELIDRAGDALAAPPSPSESHHGTVINSSFGNYPADVIKIARQMRGLDEAQFLTLCDLTHKQAWSNVYSLLQYRGTAWYLPTLRPIEEGEPGCGIGYDRNAGVWVAVGGWRLELNVVGYIARIAMVIGVWLTLWSLFPSKELELKGSVFDPAITILFAAITGGIIARVLRIPPLVCVLWMGILWNNVPSVGYFTSGTTKYVRGFITTFGLNVILIRAGLYIKPEELKPFLGSFAMFAFLPAIGELISHSFIAQMFFRYPNTNWAFMHGSVAAAVSPAIVVPGVLTLRLDGFGVTRGPGHYMMPAAPVEMVAAVWLINFMASLTLDTGDVPLWLNILLGPLQILGGILLGVILGGLHFLALKVFLGEARKLPHRHYTVEHMNGVSMRSTALLVITGVAVLAFTKKVNLAGGGAVATTVMAMTTSALIRRRSDAHYFSDQFKSLCLSTADLWDSLVMPALFAMVGSNIDLGKVFTADFFPPMLACTLVGCAARMVISNLVTSHKDFTPGERAVMAIGWCGKATVQATMGRVALDRAKDIFETVVSQSGRAAAEENLQLATNVANAAVVLIIVCAPIAALTIVRVGPLVMKREPTGVAAH